MKRRYKLLGGFLALSAIAISALAITLSYDSDCEVMPAPDAGTELMTAVTYNCYGSTDVLTVSQVAKPTPGPNELLVKVHKAAVNPLDWHFMRGTPYFMRLMSGIGAPDDMRLGVDFSGTVEAVGEEVTMFRSGDAVFGGRSGAFAEYVRVREAGAVVAKPDTVSFAEAAAVPIAAITALQALRDKGKLKAGQRVLINGASGGVGTYAVQIAKHLGAHVTGVCSTRNVEMVRSLGADRVIDYKKDDYTKSEQAFDLIIDMVGNHPLSKNRRVLTPDGTLVIVGAEAGNWLGPMKAPLKAMFLKPFIDQDISMILSEFNREDMQTLADLMQAGKMRSVIDREFPLGDIAQAIEYSETGRARGKIIISVE